MGVMLIIYMAVSFFLLLAADRMCGYPPQVLRCLVGAATAGLYAGLCFIPGLECLNRPVWRLLALGMVSGAAYGFRRSTFRRGAVFLLLMLALEGIGGTGNVPALILSVAGLLLLSLSVGTVGSCGLVPVEISSGCKHIQLKALQDTGNLLRDPVTGSQVIVVGPDIAQKLTGLTQMQLRFPVESLDAIPGLRLIPYHSIGNPSGMLLARRFSAVRIGNWRGSTLVAFAPEGISTDGSYEALTGGAIG